MRLSPRHIYRWDLDKTYLQTDFRKLSRMVKIAFEGPEAKKNVPGSAALLRALAAPQEGRQDSYVAIISGSPTQMRRVLEQKLHLDGVRWDEFQLKPQWENLKRRRFRAITEQVGYKLPLLLESRLRMEPGVGETLFGDDAEGDAYIYSLYADVVAGRIGGSDLRAVLEAAGAYPEAIERCMASVRQLEPSDDVQRIFINLDEHTPPDFFSAFGPRVVPVFNYFQAALVLFVDGHIGVEQVETITRAFLAGGRRRSADPRQPVPGHPAAGAPARPIHGRPGVGPAGGALSRRHNRSCGAVRPALRRPR